MVERNPHMANLAVAWIATKFTEPIRLGFAVLIVPKIARTLGFANKTAFEEEDVDKGAKGVSATTVETADETEKPQQR
jgi:hypothetical protein